jgi:RNA polymerase sigma factor for flagellar operon FliA
LLESLHEPTDQTSSEVLEQKEKVAILKDLIKDLPTQQKQILMLYYYEELRLSEIAEIFSLTEGRISQILSQCILILKSKFKTII